MLSRIAESLFWIGRYIERADDTSRILDVHIHHLLEAPNASEGELCQSLLTIMGVAQPNAARPDYARTDYARSDYGRADRVDPGLTARRVTEILAFDRDNPSSIVSSLTAARANARGVSEAISSELWEALNATYNAIPSHLELGRRATPDGFFRFVREQAAVITGLTESTMSRDDAWRFIVLGRSLERVDMLTRLVSSAVAGSTPVVLLRSCSAHEAFLRTYQREPDEMTATEFLLLDRLFPRSMFFALSVAEECLAELDLHAVDTRPVNSRPLDRRSGRSGMPDEARRLLGHLRTTLEFRRIDELMEDLPGVLFSVQRGCAEVSAALAARYFRYGSPIEWSVEIVGVGS